MSKASSFSVCAILSAAVLVFTAGTIKAQDDGVGIFCEGSNLVIGRLLGGNGTFSIDAVAADAYEGTHCIKYNYDMAGMYWDMVGVTIRLSNFTTPPTAIRIAHNIPVGTYLAPITISDKNGGSTSRGAHLDGAGAWTIEGVPMADFIDGVDSLGAPKPLDWTKVSSIRFDIYTGSATGTGTIYLDSIVFVGAVKSAVVNPLVRGASMPRTSLRALTAGTVSMDLHTLNGSLVARRQLNVGAGAMLSYSTEIAPAFAAVPAGTYLVSIKGAGIDFNTKMVK